MTLGIRQFAAPPASPWSISAVVWAGLVWSVATQVAWAAPPSDWEVMRVFIRDDPEQISRLVTPHYATVLLDDLAKELAEQDNRRKVSALEVPALDEALYVGRLEGDFIVSDQSRWKLNADKYSAQPMELGRISLGLRAARGLDPGQPQLIDNTQFTPSGSVELNQSAASGEQWFGFTVNSAQQGPRRLFRFELPPAPTAKMLLATSPQVELSSPSLVIEKVPSLTQLLPDDWPSAATQASSPATQWWSIHLSGVSNFEIFADEKVGVNLTWYKHVVRSATVEYAGSDSQLAARGRFVIAGHQASTPLRMRLSKDFKIESVFVNSLPAQWRVQPSLAGDSNLIELLNLEETTENLTLDIKTLGPITTEGPMTLPEIAIAESYAMDGSCLLYGREGLVADNLQVGGTTAKRLAAGEMKSLGAMDSWQLDPIVWQTTWLGNPPPMQASFSRQRQPWTAHSLTRFSMQAEWLSATCRVQISAPQLTSNEIRLPVGQDWFIDNVRLVQTDSNIRARVEDREDAASPEIVIHWEEDRDQISFELEVVAHSPCDTTADSIRLHSPRLVTLPFGDQIDNYVIEPSSRYAVEISAKLLAYQKSLADLPLWQQQLLLPAADKWIFQGERGSMPPITLTAASGTFSSKVTTVVRQASGKLTVETRLHFVPLSGTIDQVSLLLPAAQSADRSHWQLQQGDSEALALLEASPVTTTGTQPDVELEQLVRLELPGSFNSPFTLLSQLQFDLTENPGPVTIPIVGVPGATTGESMLLLPRDIAANLSQVNIELLPVSACCSNDEILELLDDQTDQQRATWVAARIEAGVSERIPLRETPHAPRPGWVWSEQLQHMLLDNGEVIHVVQWVIEGTQLKPVEVALPEGWWVENMDINGETIEITARQQATQIDLPGLGRSTVTIRCTSHQQPPAWLSHELWPRPTLSLPVLQSRQTLVLPPARIAISTILSHALPSGTSLRLVDRLHPSTWWRLLAPTHFVDVSANTAALQVGRELQPDLPLDWSVVELTNVRESRESAANVAAQTDIGAWLASGEWTISRTAFSALALAVLLFFATSFWIGMGTSVRLWWLVGTFWFVCVILVPVWLLPLTQLLALSLVLAAFLRLCWVVCHLRSNLPVPPRSRSSAFSPIQSSPTTTTLVVLFAFCASANAQSTSSATVGPPGMASEELNGARPSKSAKEIFSVLIPIDETGEVSGAYAYAPTRLLELLAGGGDPSARSLAPKILSADYTLRTRRSLLGQPDQVQELSAEFRLQVSQADVEIRLPFNSNQVLLQRGSAAGQELFVGGRALYQLPDAIVFRPNSVGTVRLQLQFEPRELTQTSTEALLRCTIPPIPNATLRIVADSNTTFEVRSADTSRKLVASTSSELLGPVSQLEIQWSPNAPRNAQGQAAAEVFADTWLHARGSQLVAICQLRIENARSLPRELHLVAEPGWEPVGSAWGDGELVSNELSALGGRRVYTIRCAENWDSLPRRTLRVLMVPRSNDTSVALTIPFFTLREVSQQAVTRTLAWSAEEDASWRPEGLEMWRELANVTGLEWGALQWNVQPKLFRIVGTLSASLRRVSTSGPTKVEELTELHVGLGQTKLVYRAQFARLDRSLIGLALPRAARVESVKLDGVVPSYRVSGRDEQAFLEILPTDKSSGRRVVEVELSQKLEPDHELPLPRVVMRDVEATSSIYRVLRSAGLDCHVSTLEELKLEPASIPPHERLPSLESLVGQVELRNEHRDRPWLPLKFSLHPTPAAPLLGAVMALERGEQGWKATVCATWQTSDRPLDFAFFEVPVAIRDSIDTGKLPAQLVPSGDSGKMTLRLLPAPAVDGISKVEFGFALPTSASSQSLAIPQIAVLADSTTRPILALPAQLDGQPVQWSQTGRHLEDLPDNLRDERWERSFQFFELGSAQSQVGWKRFESTMQKARLLLSQVTLLKSQGNQISGYADYWIQPGGQLSLSLAIPQTCEILGVEVGNQPAIWEMGQSELSVLLQPNYMPVSVRLILHWKVSTAQPMSLDLPQVLTAERSSTTLQFVDNQLPREHVVRQPESLVETNIRQEFARCWTRTAVATFQGVSNRPVSEMITWLQQWQPQLVGLDGSETLESDQVAAVLLALGLDSSQAPLLATTNDVWSQFSIQARSKAGKDDAWTPAERSQAPLALLSSTAASPNTPVHQRIALSEGQVVLQLDKLATPSSWSSQLIAAGLLAAASLLALLLATRVGEPYARMLAYQPWIYWLQLAGVAWFILPVSWPCWVLSLTAAGMLGNQLLETRRRNRRLARV